MTEVRVSDNDPTIVSLARVGGSGGIDEGETVEFIVSLSRALVAGEIMPVPLAVGGTNVETSDWALAFKEGTGLNTGVTLIDAATTTPELRFSGAGSQTATFVLTARLDRMSETDETITVALGPDGDVPNGFDTSRFLTILANANVDQIDPSSTMNSFDVVVSNVAPPPLPTGMTLLVDTDITAPGRQVLIREDAGATTVEVTATLTGGRFVTDKTVTVSVGQFTPAVVSRIWWKFEVGVISG